MTAQTIACQLQKKSAATAVAWLATRKIPVPQRIVLLCVAVAVAIRLDIGFPLLRSIAYHAYDAARRGRNDRIDLRGAGKRGGVLTGIVAGAWERVAKRSGTMRLTL